MCFLNELSVSAVATGRIVVSSGTAHAHGRGFSPITLFMVESIHSMTTLRLGYFNSMSITGFLLHT